MRENIPLDKGIQVGGDMGILHGSTLHLWIKDSSSPSISLSQMGAARHPVSSVAFSDGQNSGDVRTQLQRSWLPPVQLPLLGKFIREGLMCV